MNYIDELATLWNRYDDALDCDDRLTAVEGMVSLASELIGDCNSVSIFERAKELRQQAELNERFNSALDHAQELSDELREGAPTQFERGEECAS